jgi:autotransporter-associated beta strand protein
VISGTGGALVKVGSGTLTLSGVNTYTGPTTVNAGTLVVNGSLASAVTLNSGGMLKGIGSVGGLVSNGGTLAPGNSIGTLNVAGNFTQNGGTYQVEVNAAGQSDKIVVTGTATLNGGTVAVQAATGSYARNTSYTILSATGGVSGTYSGVTSNLAFLTLSLSYSSNAVMLSLLSSTNSFQSGGQTPNQKAVGAALDTASPTATGDFANVLNAMYLLSTSQGPKVLDAIGGQNYAGFSSLTIQSLLLFMNSFSMHAGGSGGTSYQALKIEGSDACESPCQVEPLWGVWGGGVGAFGTVAGDGNGNGLTYNLGGFAAGLDRKFAPNFRAGVATGFNAATLYTNGMPGTGTSNTVQVALYGELVEGPFYLDALAGYAHSDNRQTRPITIPGLPFRSAQGYTTANTFFGQLEAGYKVAVAPSFGGFLTPFARLQGVTSTQNAFSESGADSLNLNVAAQTTNSLRTVLGAQLGAAIDAPWREKLNVTMRVGWSHEFADTSRPVNASFAGAPVLGFTTQGAQAPRDGVVLGFAANTKVAENTSVYLRYDGDLAGGNTNHALNAGVRYVW